jgi:hypothetical protein
MKKRDILELRRRLATITPATALSVWEYVLEELDCADDIIRRGVLAENETIDRLLSLTATRVFGRTTRVRGNEYFTLPRWGLWHGVFTVATCPTWLVYDDHSGRGLVSFALPHVDPRTWFMPLSREEPPDGHRALA